MRATNQGGSLAGFIIIGALLALVLVGGLYGLNRYNAQRAANETVTQEDDKTKTSDASRDDSATKTEKTDTSSQSDADRSLTNDSDKKEKTDKTASAPASSSSSNTQLPTTGPTDGLMALVSLGAVTFAGAHYVRSRSRA